MQRLNLRSEGDKFQIIYEPIFRVDHQTLKRYFEPAKSNIKGAFMSTDKLIFKYLKTNPDVLKQAQALMNKEDKTGKLEKIYPTTEEYKKLVFMKAGVICPFNFQLTLLNELFLIVRGSEKDFLQVKRPIPIQAQDKH